MTILQANYKITTCLLMEKVLPNYISVITSILIKHNQVLTTYIILYQFYFHDTALIDHELAIY